MSLKVILGENTAEVKLADGKSYTLSPLTLGDIADAEEKFGCDLESFDKAVKKLQNILYLVYLSLRRKNPTIQVAQVKDMFTVSDLAELTKIVESIFNISGLSGAEKAKDDEKKE